MNNFLLSILHRSLKALPIFKFFFFLIQIHDENGKTTIVKYIHVDVTCDVVLDADVNQPTEDSHSQAIRVSGTAVVVKTPGASLAKLVRVENIGLNSKINVLFLIEGSKLVFHPVP